VGDLSGTVVQVVRGTPTIRPYGSADLDGDGAIRAFAGDTLTLDLAIEDADGDPVSLASATVTAALSDWRGIVVGEDLTTSVLWAAGGRVRVTVPCENQGKHLLTITRTVGETSQTFGPQVVSVRRS